MTHAFLPLNIKTVFLFFLLLLLFGVNQCTAQTNGDYRTKKSGVWTDTSVWEIYNGTTWVNAIHYPTYRSGVITIENRDSLIIDTSLDVDQLVINMGNLILNVHGALNLKNAAGDDLLCEGGNLNINGGALNFKGNSSLVNNGTVKFNNGKITGSGAFTNNSEFAINAALLFPDSVKLVLNTGSIYGEGSLKIFGTFNQKSGDITLPLTVAGGGTFNINLTQEKYLSSITNYGTVNWNSNDIILIKGAVFSNYKYFNIYSNGFLNCVDTPALLKNTGIIEKYGTASCTIGFDVHNNGNIIVSAGSLYTTGAFINNDTLHIDKNAYCYNQGVMTLNYGCKITGGGNFFNSGTMTIGFNFSLPQSIYLIDKGSINGKGKLTVNGHMQLNDENGFLEVPLTISSTGRCEFIRAIISKPLINNGEADLNANFLYVDGTTFTNNNLVITGGNFVLNSQYKYKSKFINNGLIKQTSIYPSGILEVVFPFTNSATGIIGGIGGYEFDTLINTGTIEPGNPINGTIVFATNDPLRPTTVLSINFEKEKNGKTVNGKLQMIPKYTSLDGTLNLIQKSDSITPGSYVIVENTYGVISDTFKTVNKPAGWTIEYKTTQVIVHVPDSFNHFVNSTPRLINIENISQNSKDKITVLILPNPVSENLNLQINNIPGTQKVKMEILNERGSVVLSENKYLNKGNNYVYNNLSSLAEGIYIVRLVLQDGLEKRVKFIKQ